MKVRVKDTGRIMEVHPNTFIRCKVNSITTELFHVSAVEFINE